MMKKGGKMGIKKDDPQLEKGLEAYLKHVEQCKKEGRKHTTLQEFFSKYDPETLERVQDRKPLRKYVQRYYRELKKIQKQETDAKSV